MKNVFIIALFFISSQSHSQKDTTKWVRAFPITSYIEDLTDSIKLVQLYLPQGPQLKQMQPALLRGVYYQSHDDTLSIGSGRCHLIKGDYYYFSVHRLPASRTPKENDLLYTVVDQPLVFNGLLLRVASHFIELQSVYEEPFYDRFTIFEKWNAEDENAAIDSMVSDIHFTAQYFLKNDPSQNILISEGSFKGKRVLATMSEVRSTEVRDFLSYVIARPRLYAGRKWKISELFATWLHSGAPTVNNK